MTKDYEKTGIYTITSPSGKQYVGSAVLFMRRWTRHKLALSRGIHHSKPLQNAFNKYGLDNLIFEKIIFCKKEDLLMYEQIAIDTLNPQYNSAKIAGSKIGVKHSEETKRKISESNKGRKTSEKTRRALRDAHKIRPPHSEDTKRKMSQMKSGDKHPYAKKVICIETNVVFNTVNGAAEWLRSIGHTYASGQSVSNVITGRAKSAYGYHWNRV